MACAPVARMLTHHGIADNVARHRVVVFSLAVTSNATSAGTDDTLEALRERET